MLRVWGRVNSSNVMKILWLLDELGLAHERIDAGLAFGVVDTPAYRAMHPLGLVPVLADGELTLFESNTILRHLCRAHVPDSSLYPTEPGARARTEAWMDVQLGTLAPPLGVVVQQLVRTPADRRDEAALAEALPRAGAVMAVLDDQLVGRRWLVGSGMTLADIAMGPLVHRWFALRLARAEAPNVRAWYDRLLERPAYVARCAQPLT